MGMKLIEHIEVGAGGVLSSTFSNIPQDAVDLVLFMSARSSAGSTNDSVLIRVNGNFATTNARLYAQANTIGQDTSRPENTANGSTSNAFGSISYYFSNYAVTGPKMVIADFAAPTQGSQPWLGMVATQMTVTDPITSMEISEPVLQHSTYSLYKITAD
tara:strand:+ start:1019 stop:1495 length:477 start_codon:yes stop_codon:yes gene_type:complete